MRIVFVSNYFNHHQRPLCEALATAQDVDFTFLQVEAMDPERVRMGWGIDIADYPYVRLYHADAASSARLVLESEVVIFGGVDDEDYILPRLEAGRFTLRYSERIYKEGQWKFLSPRGLRKKYHDHVRFRQAPVYLLCAGAYVASDYALIHAYPGKKYVWGYFPEVVEYTEETLHEKRLGNERLELLWSGRMLDWKHPEDALAVAQRLQEAAVDFHLTYVGGGTQEAMLRERVEEQGLSGRVDFVGFLRPEEVREYMRRADIYLFTSDYREGWGASVNEAMNSGCAVVASHAAGAVPYLIRHGVSGMVYRFLDRAQLCDTVCGLAMDPEERRRMGSEAYRSIWKRWRAEVAAGRLLEWIRAVLPQDGPARVDRAGALPPSPMQPAPVIAPGKGYQYARR